MEARSFISTHLMIEWAEKVQLSCKDSVTVTQQKDFYKRLSIQQIKHLIFKWKPWSQGLMAFFASESSFMLKPVQDIDWNPVNSEETSMGVGFC